MVLWSLFREVDIEEITRQLAPCVWAITRHSAVNEYFVDFRGRLVGQPPIVYAQQLLDFIEDRKSDEEFIRKIRQALDRNELKGILRADSTAPSGSVNQEKPTNPRLADPNEQEGQRQELRRIADWLSPLNFKASQIDHLRKRHGDSGKWFIEDQKFKDWRDGGPGTLWCPGSPGAGKTVLAAIIIDHLKTFYNDGDASITWIYCNYKEKAEQTICNLVGSLLKQTVENKSSISEDVKALYDRHQRDNTKPSLAELERLTNSEFRTNSKVFVVVDALDECPEDTGTQTELLEVLEIFSRTAKVLITSRDIPSIKQWLGSEKAIRIKARDEDIRRYILGQIDRRRKPHLKRLENEIVRNVSGRAEGMFLLARLLMDLIVVKVNSEQVRKVLEDMPKGIDAVYADALGRIREQNEEQRKLGEQVLKWVIFAFRPLLVEELQEALAVVWETTRLNRDAIADEETLMSACAGLVTIEKGWDAHRHVRLIHYTAQDYFDRTRTVHFPDAHKDIAKTFITYLSQDILLEIEDLGYGVMQDLMECYHLLGYASDSWGDHIREQSDEECDRMVHEFLDDERKTLLPGWILNRRSYPEVVGFMGIHLSSFFGLEHIIEKQLLSGANPNKREYRGQTLIRFRGRNGDEVVEMTSAGLDVDIDVIDGDSLPDDASLTDSSLTDDDSQAVLSRRYVKAVHVELGKQNRIYNWTDKDGRTPLLIAVEYGYVKVVELLLAQPNVDINLVDMGRRSPLLIAVKNGHVRVVELLLAQSNVDINLADVDGQTPLMLAAVTGNVEVGKLLLAQSNVEINLADMYGQTPLMLAAGNRHVEMVELLLLQSNVDINLTDKVGQTPVVLAARNRHLEMVELLLAQSNVNINLADEDGQTPLMLATRNRHLEMMELLLAQSNVNINLADKDCETPLTLAARNGHVEMMELLLAQSNGDINLADEDCQTLLILAAENGHVKVVKLLLAQSNVDINFAYEDGQTPLMFAAANGHMEVVELLLEQSNVNINLTDEDGWTPLMWGSRNGHVEVVELLLKQPNISVSLMNKPWVGEGSHAKVVMLLLGQDNLKVQFDLEHGLIPLYLAAEYGHEKLVKFLLDHPNVAIDSSQSLSNTPVNVPCKKLDVSLVYMLEHESVQCVHFSADGNFLATGDNHTVQIFDTKTGVKMCHLVNENTAKSKADESIYSLCFSWDGRYLATGSADKLIRIWDIHGESIWRILKGHQRGVQSVDFSPDGRFIVSGSWDGTARIWNIGTSENKVLLENNLAVVWSVAFSPDGRLAATASDDIIRLWDTQSGALIERLGVEYDNYVRSIAFIRDGKGLVSGGDFTVNHWDLSPLLRSSSRFVPLSGPYDRFKREQSEKGTVCTATFKGREGVGSSVAVSYDGEWVVSGSEVGSVRFWGLHTGQAELVLWGHEGSVVSVDLSPTGGMLATGSKDGCAKLWRYTWG